MHAAVSSGVSHAGPITTISATTLERGEATVELLAEYQRFDTFSDSELIEFGERGEDVHNMRSLTQISLGLAYGVTNDLTLHARIPYIQKKDIAEVHHEEGSVGAPENGSDLNGDHEHGIERLGDAQGIGDLALFAHYRFLNVKESGFESALIAGLKMPTGKTSEKSDSGERLEAEFQPGSGSWDPMLGIAVTKRYGRLSFDANVLYTFVTRGTQNTDLGDIFGYNAALSYQAVQGKFTLDLILEGNGVWRAKEQVDGAKDSNSGGNIIYLSPGIRVSWNNRVKGFMSAGFPVVQDLNGFQNEVDYRLVFGLHVGL